MVSKKIKDICRECKLCKNNPENYWDEFPQGCKLYDRIFVKREKDMEEVRRAKEELLALQIEREKSGLAESGKSAKEYLLEKFINKFKQYGAENW